MIAGFLYPEESPDSWEQGAWEIQVGATLRKVPQKIDRLQLASKGEKVVLETTGSFGDRVTHGKPRLEQGQIG